MRRNYIAIEGNIGAGKTTLAKMLAKEWNARLMLEEFAENPFLPGFYKDPEKHAFPLELSFLGERFEQLKRVFSKPDLFQPTVISDYYIIKSLLFAKINLGELEYELFQKLFHLIADNFPQPDLLVYLNTSISDLQANIRKRGRTYEQNIQNEYLQKVQDQYLDFFKTETNIPVLVLNTENLDFVKEKKVFKQIVQEISKPYQPGLQFTDL